MAGETDVVRQQLVNRRATLAEGSAAAARADELIARLDVAQKAYDDPPAMPSDRQRLIGAINAAEAWLKA